EAELKWLTGELADARSLDVFMFETFRPTASKLGDRHATAVFGKALLQAHERGHARAAAAVASPRFRLLLLDAARWIETGVDPDLAQGPADRPAADFAEDALDRRRRALRRRLEALDWRDPLERHKTRIAAKKMRYASEFFVGLGPASSADAYAPFIRSLSRLQDELGSLNDLAVAEPLVPSVLEDAPLEEPESRRVGYAAGLIMGWRLARSKKLTKSARRAGDVFLDTPTWW
ncbi:MAG TPA: CHAD domain-containing protein, partial [Caulobacteraceae bacterium]